LSKYIWLVVSFALVYVLGDAILTQINKSAKATRIECQKKAISFERVYLKEDIKFAQKLLREGNIEFTSSVQKAKYTKSKLFEYVKLFEADEVLKSALRQYIKEKKISDNKLNISYYIYENDVNDPGKKTKKSKLYAGYVVFRFFNPKDEPIYQVQIDFMDKKGKDLPQRIKCAVESFNTL